MKRYRQTTRARITARPLRVLQVDAGRDYAAGIVRDQPPESRRDAASP
jgi:hypothetical protein